jgi:chromatin segregation and condensation protein Rec8/ScpA/Scc1 (kleisin family)
MDEKKIMDYLVSEYSWEQVIYEIVAWSGMNPWDLDISRLADHFMKYLQGIKSEDMDFRIPAKYIIVAAVLLKMKSDYIRAFKEQITGQEEQEMQQQLMEAEQPLSFTIDPLAIPPRREPTRRIVVSELVDALRKVLKAKERRYYKHEELKKKIEISTDNINERIKSLYSRINMILARINNNEVGFSKLVDKWERDEVVDNFVPLVHLDNDGKVVARQERFFDEIWVSRGSKK